MKRYAEQNNYWKTAKALTFFANFVRRHNAIVADNDTFALVGSLVTAEELTRRIKETFPAKTITRMQEVPRFCRLDFDDEPKEMFREIWYADFARPRLKKLIQGIVDRYLEQHPLDRNAEEPFAKRCAELQKTLSLSEFETDLLLAFAFISSGMLEIVGENPQSRHTDEKDKAVFAAKCLDCDVSEVLAALDEKNKHRRYECVDNDFDFNNALMGFLDGVRSEPLTSSYFRRSTDEVLPWGFYGTLVEKHGGILKRIIDGANGKSPVNILLYGAPGTGKTSFARTLAAELKRECYAVAQNTQERGGGRTTSSPSFRFAALQICDSQVDPAKSLIIVDEADEMLRGNSCGGFFALFGGGAFPPGTRDCSTPFWTT